MLEGTMTPRQALKNIDDGNRGDARLAIRMHPDPAAFVLDIIGCGALEGRDIDRLHTDLVRLMSV